MLDPVARATSGTPLIDPGGVGVIREQLLPRVGWVTPNLDELAILAWEEPGIPEAAARLQRMGAGN